MKTLSSNSVTFNLNSTRNILRSNTSLYTVIVYVFSLHLIHTVRICHHAYLITSVDKTLKEGYSSFSFASSKYLRL